MAGEPKVPVGRREFLVSAAAAGATSFIGGADTNAAQDAAHSHQLVPSDVALRVKALESVLVEKGVLESADLDAVVETYTEKIGPRNGARVVARAWSEPEFKRRLLADATEANDAKSPPAKANTGEISALGPAPFAREL